jgi:hypothetical protein
MISISFMTAYRRGCTHTHTIITVFPWRRKTCQRCIVALHGRTPAAYRRGCTFIIAAVAGELITGNMPSSIRPLLGGSDYREGPCDRSSMEDAGLRSIYRELDALSSEWKLMWWLPFARPEWGIFLGIFLRTCKLPPFPLSHALLCWSIHSIFRAFLRAFAWTSRWNIGLESWLVGSGACQVSRL